VATEPVGTKAAAHYKLEVPRGATVTVRLRLTDIDFSAAATGAFYEFDRLLVTRKNEADEFYRAVVPQDLSPDAQNVMRQSFAGMLWSKQFYHYELKRWLEGDPGNPQPPAERRNGRNKEWVHLYNADVISMPDKWEYPWYAAWDLAFHCVPLALVDCEFAKEQLVLLLREWYMHPNGQLAAYEWALGEVNPPVHAWATWRVYKIDKKRNGKGDRAFLERVFHKLLLNFTWWVNRKDADGMNIFQGGFLGLDNIGVFDRGAPLPTGGYIEQSDGTSWMAMYTLNLLAIALELAREDPAYEDVASKFWEHFIYIAHAMNHRGSDGMGLWDEMDGFFYDVLRLPDGRKYPMRIRSMVGLIPLFAVETLEPELLDRLPGFKRRLEWFIDNRRDLVDNVACMRTGGNKQRRLLSIVGRDQLRRVLQVMLDEQEFLSPYGIRALSRHHHEHPYTLAVNGTDYRVNYEPAESSTGLFGGNSNWRGPIWFPVNYLLIESLQKFHHYLGDSFTVEFPARSGRFLTLWEVAAELSRRLSNIFLRDDKGERPVYHGISKFQADPNWNDLLMFHEYFHGDTGRGVGASHQTGWTGLVAKLLQQSGESGKRMKREHRIAFTD
jgi:Glycosyl hydrolase family 63 C-terminal domain